MRLLAPKIGNPDSHTYRETQSKPTNYGVPIFQVTLNDLIHNIAPLAANWAHDVHAAQLCLLQVVGRGLNKIISKKDLSELSRSRKERGPLNTTRELPHKTRIGTAPTKRVL